jgi:hypothetical protein
MDSWVPKEIFDGSNMIMEYEKRKGEHHSRKMVEKGYDFADWASVSLLTLGPYCCTMKLSSTRLRPEPPIVL